MDGELAVTLTEALRRRLVSRAAAASPREDCGVLLGERAGNALHVRALAPVGNRATGNHRFEIGAGDVHALERTHRTGDVYVCGFYHSHPTHSAVPSAADAAGAWPGYVYLIADLAGTVRAWQLCDTRAFRELPLSTV